MNNNKRSLKDLPSDLNALDDDQDQADEDRNLHLDEEVMEEDVEGENLDDKFDEDYKAIPALDRYDPRDLDDNPVGEDLTQQGRRRAEREMALRDRIERHGRNPAALYETESASVFSDDQEISKELRARREQHFQEIGLEDDDAESEIQDIFNPDEIKGRLDNHIRDPKIINYIKRRLRKFFLTYKDENGQLVYENRINQMCSKNKQSLELTYIHLTEMEPTIAYWLFENPALIFPFMNEVGFEITCKQYPGYENIHEEIFVKIREFPMEESLRELRTHHLNTLLKVQGVITRRYPVYSQLKKIFYLCPRCGNRMGPIYQNDAQESMSLGQCDVCHFNGPFEIDSEQTVYRNYQKVTIQESPGSVLPGRVPRHKDVILLGDNIDSAKPGDEVEVVGIYSNKLDYSMNVKHGFPVFNTFIEANNVKKIQDLQIAELTQEEKKQIHNYAKQSNIMRIIVNSIAPSIYGLHHVKTAMALAMFGGEAQNIGGSHKIRGDINVLLLGDPGLAKSQFLKYVEQTFHRTVYTTGKGASAVGLTASVRKDYSSGEWTLEGGAMVLADQGICLIDEFDKMNEIDRTSIHEAMEQQSISISKAGIVASLQARCSVIAAANPIKGRYNKQLSFSDNVNLSEPILSRFDILCVLKDTIESTQDKELATFIVNSHIKSHPNYDEQEHSDCLLTDVVKRVSNLDQMPQQLLKKYIIYARKHCHPRLGKSNIDKISKFYAELRQESLNVGGISIVTRHIESLIRMAQASARIHLRAEVQSQDVDLAISVLLESFIQSQKTAIGKVIKNKFSSYLTFKEDINVILLQMLDRLFNEQLQFANILAKDGEMIGNIKVPIEMFTQTAQSMNVFNTDKFIQSDVFKQHFVTTGGNIERKDKQIFVCWAVQ